MSESFRTRIAHDLATQDNRATAHPMFVVQQRRRIYGMGHDYSDELVWLDEEGDEHPFSGGDPPKDWTETRYIDLDGHNLTDPRIYVASAHRNHEWQTVRELLSRDPAQAHHKDVEETDG